VELGWEREFLGEGGSIFGVSCFDICILLNIPQSKVKEIMGKFGADSPEWESGVEHVTEWWLSAAATRSGLTRPSLRSIIRPTFRADLSFSPFVARRTIPIPAFG